MRRQLVIALALLLFGPAACTQAKPDNGIASAGGAGTATVTSVPGGGYDQARWVRCLREQGLVVDDADPSDPGGGKPRIHDDVSTKEQIDAAAEACRAYNPHWGRIVPPDPADIERQRQFARCMREHGIDWDDPDPGGQTPAEVPSDPEAGKPTPSGPEFERATRECGQQVPGVLGPDDGHKAEPDPE